MGIANQKGNVITYVIIVMSMIAALGVGALYMTSSSALGELGANNANRAYFLALAGKDYALIKNLGDTATAYPTGRDFTLTNGDIFRLVIKCPDNTIESTGIVNEGTPREARRTISITKTGYCSQSDISGFAGMTPKNQPGSSVVQVNGTGTTASLGRWESGRFGALWYSGGAFQGNCTGGKCSFGPGFRAFFVFKFDAGSTGDGFTFAFFNGDGVGNNQNDINSIGGDSGRGELLGYAGDSRIDAAGTSFLDGKGGRGIQPPKIAVEFDPYANFGSSNVCVSGSRRDGNDNRNHVAYVFWGENTDNSCHTPATVGSNTYDDNRHNNGTDKDGPNNPMNSKRPTDGDDTSYYNASSLWPSNTSWLLSNAPTNIYAFRVEVTRASSQNGNTNYFYSINSWIKQCNLADCSDVITSSPGYDNTKIPYASQPTLMRTIELNQTLHDYFASFFFGWTAATGSATQNITLSNFKMNFVKETSGCGGYGVWNNLGSTFYFRINGVGCTGIANNAFIGNIGASGSISGFADAACTSGNESSPASITFAQASTADTNKNCAVYFSGADR